MTRLKRVKRKKGNEWKIIDIEVYTKYRIVKIMNCCNGTCKTGCSTISLT